MGAPLQHGGNLSGVPGTSLGLCWLRARLELGRSKRLAARLPFRVKAGRVSTEADRLPFEGREVPSLKRQEGGVAAVRLFAFSQAKQHSKIR
ncbi:hypothetical protein NDU88_002190 [Pleurodeles waltl]|uniref:Uncharacterized protein n=1 Tax=Pleurodeles waltl TaxID=8319 RepID=A0AAV7RD27_PLEWA|nr:hypothetical protein NDU88_002190 [Pleurodeles waltl]